MANLKRRKAYKPSKTVLRFIAMLADNARQYRWGVVRGSAIRGFAPEIRNGKCTTPGEKAFCPITACYPTGRMHNAAVLAHFFGLTKKEGNDIMIAADCDGKAFTQDAEQYYVVKTLRPLLLAAVGLPPEPAV